jgi:TetR/AcrR family transcriptional regulator, lmrAB and yxaGH operons repressor
MGQRSDTKDKMVQAAKQLLRERGYNATALSDVLELSDAPRGSVYFHFPGGKAQLAMEAAAAHGHEQIEIIDLIAGQADSAVRLVELYVTLGRDSMVAANYGRGCGIAPLIVEATIKESAELRETSRRGFSEMVDRLAFHLVVFGIERTDARILSDAVVTGVEGAMITSRALHSTTPYDAIRTVLAGHAAGLSRRGSSGRR